MQLDISDWRRVCDLVSFIGDIPCSFRSKALLLVNAHVLSKFFDSRAGNIIGGVDQDSIGSACLMIDDIPDRVALPCLLLVLDAT